MIIFISVHYLLLANLQNMNKHVLLRDWSLITGREGGYKMGGGAREVLPLQKGGGSKVLAILKGGYKKFWGSFYVDA